MGVCVWVAQVRYVRRHTADSTPPRSPHIDKPHTPSETTNHTPWKAAQATTSQFTRTHLISSGLIRSLNFCGNGFPTCQRRLRIFALRYCTYANKHLRLRLMAALYIDRPGGVSHHVSGLDARKSAR